LNQLVVELGAQINVLANGNAITSGDLLDQPPSVVRSIVANNKVAQQSAAIAKLITYLRATAVGMALGVIII
jgi:hypothetical protein